MNRPLLSLVLVHLKEFARQPGILFWAFGFPIAISWILGLAFSKQDQIEYEIALINGDPAQITERFRFCQNEPSERSENITLKDKDANNSIPRKILCLVVANQEEAYRYIKKGRVGLFVEALPKDPSRINVYFDPQNPEANFIYLFIKDLMRGSDQNNGIAIKKIAIQSKGNRYIDFLVPGLIALSILNSCLWGTGWNLIELRVKNLMRRLTATPMKKTDFMFSFAIVRIFTGVIEFFLLYGFAYYYFDVIIQGSWLALLIIFLVGNIAFTGIAILSACRANNTRIGNGVINAITIPMTIVSGIFFSYHNFPEELIFFIKLLPLTALADSIRIIFNEGAGVFEIMRPSIVLSLEGILTFSLGIRFFKWQ